MSRDRHMDDRLTALEERVAHLLRSAEDLTDTLLAQRRELDRLTRLVELLVRREAEREAAGPDAPPRPDERPPHW